MPWTWRAIETYLDPSIAETESVQVQVEAWQFVVEILAELAVLIELQAAPLGILTASWLAQTSQPAQIDSARE